ncbi:hypothetical protein GQ53DRAFT_815601 [Thozetella sp. PMI_491]|nr:hypothetical protein GQ53DRAFT_815601 [Thozetella sp. PMI_491]
MPNSSCWFFLPRIGVDRLGVDGQRYQANGVRVGQQSDDERQSNDRRAAPISGSRGCDTIPERTPREDCSSDLGVSPPNVSDCQEIAYARDLYGLYRQYNVLCIVDEVHQGAGNTGKFLSYQHIGDDFKPGIVTMGKSITGVTILHSRQCGRHIAR